jgi:hypothetical protein
MTLPSDFWPNERKTLANILLPRIEHAAFIAQSQAAQKMNISFNPTLANKDAEQWASDYTDTVLQQLDTTTQDGVGEIISNWIDTPGATYGDLVQSLMDTHLFDQVRASRIATTEMTRAFAQGESMAYERELGLTAAVLPVEDTHVNCECWLSIKRAGGQDYIVWQTNKDTDVCTQEFEMPWGTVGGCQGLDGVIVSEGDHLGEAFDDLEKMAIIGTMRKGGEGSGDFDHEGRPGLVGGSGPGCGEGKNSPLGYSDWARERWGDNAKPIEYGYNRSLYENYVKNYQPPMENTKVNSEEILNRAKTISGHPVLSIDQAKQIIDNDETNLDFSFRGDDFIPKDKFQNSSYHGDDAPEYELPGTSSIYIPSTDESDFQKAFDRASTYGDNVFLLRGRNINADESFHDSDEVLVQDNEIVAIVRGKSLNKLAKADATAAPVSRDYYLRVYKTRPDPMRPGQMQIAWIVDGDKLRDPNHDPHYIDFTEGGNDLVYGGQIPEKPKLCEPGEVLIDNANIAEADYILIHETIERDEMWLSGEPLTLSLYDRIHAEKANPDEFEARHDEDPLAMLAAMGWDATSVQAPIAQKE